MTSPQLNGVSRGILLILLVTIIAILGVLQAQFAGTITSALLLGVIAVGVYAGYEQYVKLGGKMGPTIPLTTIVTILLTVAFTYYPSLLGATTWGAKIGVIIGALLLIEQDLNKSPSSIDAMIKDVVSSVKP